MPRLARVGPIGVAQHIIQRGNNRQVCFEIIEVRYRFKLCIMGQLAI